MNERDKDLLMEQRFRFMGFSSKRKKYEVFNILSYCKEIRNTAYPMKDSLVTELTLVEFAAHKQKDHIYINGSMSLVDGDRSENRWLDAYIFEDKSEGKIRVYMDIERHFVEDEPKLIRTSEVLIEDEKNVMSITVYAGGEISEQKEFVEEFPKNITEDEYYNRKSKQISASL